MEQIVIVGSGPAGLTCAIYAARSGLSPTVISGEEPGGQLTKTSVIENFPGFRSIDGADFMAKMMEQSESCGAKIIFESVKKIEKTKDEVFLILLSDGVTVSSRSVVIATGASHKKLGIPGELELSNKGVSWCATCDGPMYRGKRVAVIGGGNSALMEAIFLTQFADDVFLLHRRDSFRADNIMCHRASDNPKIHILWNSVVSRIVGDSKVREIVIEDVNGGEKTVLPVNGVFIAIGTRPVTEFIGDILDFDDEGYIKTQNGSAETSCRGIFAAGDVVSGSLKQAVYAAGAGALAACNAEEFLGVR
ncbi:MAG: thioredoxin-disulfide reductase [Holosporales bacterium]|jgi:thioredoxin reductase (NADPH)|nr:thioredoxin-disulfide reductase [Holosporales bacterium]